MTSTRINLRIVQPKCHTSTYGMSWHVRYYGAKLWNELDEQVKESVSFNLADFKKKCKLDWSSLFLFDMHIMYGATRTVQHGVRCNTF